MKLCSLLILSFFSVTSAQFSNLPLLSDLSTSCLNSVVSLVSSEISSCLHLTSATSLLSTSNSSIAPSLNDYFLEEICSNPACTQETLNSANSTIYDGCGNELSQDRQDLQNAVNDGQVDANDVGGISLPTLLVGVINNYGIIRNSGCLMDRNANDETCLAQYIYTIQNITGETVSINNAMQLVSNMEDLSKIESQLSANETAFCTPCTQALYSQVQPTLQSTFNESTLSNITSRITNICGNDFILINGSLPASIKNGTVEAGDSDSDSTSSSQDNSDTDGALTLGSVIVMVGLGLVGSGFALLL